MENTYQQHNTRTEVEDEKIKDKRDKDKKMKDYFTQKQSVINVYCKLTRHKEPVECYNKRKMTMTTTIMG